MSKKYIILISAILGLLLISLVGYYYIIQNNPSGTGNAITTGFKNFFPFGGDDNPIDNPDQTNPNEQATTTEQIPTPTSSFTQKLRKLSIDPVAGVGTVEIKAGTLVRYIEKETGHIYQVEMFSPKQDRISNTTIPVVYDAVWGNNSNSLITRYLQGDDVTVDTYSLTLKATTTVNTSTTTQSTLAGIAFPGGVSDVSISNTSVFYLQQSSGFSQGYTSNFDGSKKKLIWNSEIKELNSQFVNDKTVALTTKPYPGVNGYLYFIDTTTGQVRRILGNVPGLSTLVNSAGTSVLYVEQGSSVKLSLFDTKTKLSTEVSPRTFPEKCVWSKKDLTIVYCAVPKESLSNGTLSSWYMGTISFQDDIWKYNLKDNTATIVENLSEDSGQQIDVVKPMLSPNEQYLVFVNKIDGSLWSLDLTK